MRIKGWILSYTIILMLISSLILTTMIVVAGFQKKLFSNAFNSYKLELNNISGLNYFLSNSIDNFNSQKKFESDFKITQKKWGHLKLIRITSYAGVDSLIKPVLIGSVPSYNDPIISLDESSHGLKLSGKCELIGTIEIPKHGIEILNKLYSPSDINITRAEISHRNTSTNSKNLPSKSYYSAPYENLSFINNIDSINQYFSFNRNSSYFYSEQEIELLNNIQGNIIIESNDKIFIDTHSQLEDLILIAPQIEIANNWSGAIQLFTDHLILGENITFLYPSSISVNTSNEKYSLNFKSSCTLNGYLNIHGQKECKITPKISGKINGYIHSDIPLDFNAKLSGQISCPYFKHSTSSSSYINLIYNSTVNSDFQQKGIPIPVSSTNSSKAFIKWLD
ncbi:hypothetical protein KFE94_07315 [bacterium SCSIO 12643]|nr:hypothetical protein KFE94_07315 [bacterium SCSIO 12643]